MKVRVDLACSRRSHSGEQCEVKRIAKRLEQARRDPTTQSHYCKKKNAVCCFDIRVVVNCVQVS